MITNNKSAAKIPLLIIAGPTAAGKSALAMEIARLLKTDIISADSAQVYRYLNIGTAKATLKEQTEIKHHLIDIIDPDQRFSAAEYQAAATKMIQELWNDGKLPLLVGGTGLYIRALTAGYAFGQKGANQAVREALEKESEEKGLDTLHARLRAIDPLAAKRIHEHDRKRIIRALEVYQLEGKPISEQIHNTTSSNSPYKLIYLVVSREREELYDRIDKRVDTMIASGLLEEVQSLLQIGYKPFSPGLQILGYRQLTKYLEKQIDWNEALQMIKTETRRLAKRQLTWFRREPVDQWLDFSLNLNLMTITENICRKVKDIIT